MVAPVTRDGTDCIVGTGEYVEIVCKSERLPVIGFAVGDVKNENGMGLPACENMLHPTKNDKILEVKIPKRKLNFIFFIITFFDVDLLKSRSATMHVLLNQDPIVRSNGNHSGLFKLLDQLLIRVNNLVRLG